MAELGCWLLVADEDLLVWRWLGAKLFFDVDDELSRMFLGNLLACCVAGVS